jgi:molybdopterin converting factor small subunit
VTIRVKLFAILRDLAGVGELSLELPAGSSVAAATETLAAQFPTLRRALPRTAAAVNQIRVTADTTLNDNDELALLPPVSGG